MSGVGFWELILVFLIGLIVLGPERLPRVASQLGTWLGQARRMTRVMKRQLEDELNLEEQMTVRPRRSALPPPMAPKRVEDVDDTYSPAHDAKSIGTGVDESLTPDENRDIDDAAAGDDDPEKVPGDAPQPDKTT